MALVFNSRRLCLDSNGNPISGAKLYVYNATTVVLASLFTSATLATPLANPVVADSSGVFPQIHMAEGAIVDTQTFTSAGVHLSNLDELSVIALGSNTGTFSRDFSNSRFQVRGSGGTVYAEAGDPVGDDVGGTGVLGGWAGTQADSWAVNAALFNVIGRIKEGSRKLPGVVRSEAVAFTAVSSVDIPLTNDPTGTLVWDIDINALDLSTTGVGVTVRFSYDGGSTYLATSTYYSMLWLVDAAGATQTGGTLQDAQSSGQILSGQNTTAPVATSGQIRMRVSTPDSGSRATAVMGNAAMFAASAHMSLTNFAVSNAHGSRATHVRLICGTGTFSGVYRVVPQRGFGET